VPRLLDLCCGRWGWSKSFASRGWHCTGVDLQRSEAPHNCELWIWNVLDVTADYVSKFDFGCASTPCDEFALFGMKHFHPNPPYPKLGIKLFNHVRAIFEEAQIPYVMENVKAAQHFVGPAVHHCGSFWLWGNAVPPLMPQGISKTKWTMRTDGGPGNTCPEFYIGKKERAAKLATIPPELANCVAQYAERILETRLGKTGIIYLTSPREQRT